MGRGKPNGQLKSENPSSQKSKNKTPNRLIRSPVETRSPSEKSSQGKQRKRKSHSIERSSGGRDSQISRAAHLPSASYEDSARSNRDSIRRTLGNRPVVKPRGRKQHTEEQSHAVHNRESEQSWGGLQLKQSVIDSILEMGYESPTEIQGASIPWLLEGRDVVGQAVTGTGKTAAFGIPMCNAVDPGSRDVQGLVLVPTRELAQQVTREITLIGRRRGVGVVAVYGGDPIARQIKALERGMSIVVGTPGRVKDHMNRRTLDLSRVRMAVLDEADEMLDIGFADDMEYILRYTPRKRQTALFSATIPGFIRGLIRRYLVDPRWVQLVSDAKGLETVDEVDQIFFDVASQDKADGIMEILDDIEPDSQILIFRQMQIGVDRLAKGLAGEGFPVKGIHGGMSQTERNNVMSAFRDGSLRILVATNLAARGLDIPTISHVINYDMPANIEEYVHRIGRTARMGKRGTAISFIGEWDFEMQEQIVAKIGEDKMISRRFSFY